jgi:hypothetical protein
MEIAASLGGSFVTPCLALVEDIREQIAESRRRRSTHADREVESLKTIGRRLWRKRRRACRIVAAAPIRIDERLICFSDLAELRRGQPIPRIDVRMVLAGQSFVGALDLAYARRPLEAEENIEIHELQISDCRLQIDSRLRIGFNLQSEF